MNSKLALLHGSNDEVSQHRLYNHKGRQEGHLLTRECSWGGALIHQVR